MAQHTKTMESAASDQTSREATRGLNPPILRSYSASPFIPTPLYSTAVCQTLQERYGGRFVSREEPSCRVHTLCPISRNFFRRSFTATTSSFASLVMRLLQWIAQEPVQDDGSRPRLAV